MGLLNTLQNLKQGELNLRILFLGLDNAGKTTILKVLSKESIESVAPTQGFNIQTLTQDGCKVGTLMCKNTLQTS